MLHKKTAAHRVELATRSNMFAVIKTGGKQYKVAAEDEIVIMTLPRNVAGSAIVRHGRSHHRRVARSAARHPGRP